MQQPRIRSSCARMMSLVAACLLTAGPAGAADEAAQILGVRQRAYPKFDRIVLDLDRMVPVRRMSASGRLELEIAARPVRERQIVGGAVEILRLEDGTTRVQAAIGALQIRVFTLREPPRLVIDLGEPGLVPFVAPWDGTPIFAEAAAGEAPEQAGGPTPSPTAAEVLPSPREPALAEAPTPPGLAPAPLEPAPERAPVSARAPDPPPAPEVAPPARLPQPEAPEAGPDASRSADPAPAPPRQAEAREPATRPAPGPSLPPAARGGPGPALWAALAAALLLLVVAAALALTRRRTRRARGFVAEPRRDPTLDILLEDLGPPADRVELLEKRLDEEVRARILLQERLAQLSEEQKVLRDRLRRTTLRRSEA